MENAFTTPGAFSWCELMTTDPAAALKFYQQLFGWETEENAMGHCGYTVVKAGGTGVAGVMGMPPNAPPMPPMWSCYVTVKDVHATAKLAAELGGQVVLPPMEVAGVGTFCVIRDPQGAGICAITYQQCPSAPPQS